MFAHPFVARHKSWCLVPPTGPFWAEVGDGRIGAGARVAIVRDEGPEWVEPCRWISVPRMSGIGANASSTTRWRIVARRARPAKSGKTGPAPTQGNFGRAGEVAEKIAEPFPQTGT